MCSIGRKFSPFKADPCKGDARVWCSNKKKSNYEVTKVISLARMAENVSRVPIPFMINFWTVEKLSPFYLVQEWSLITVVKVASSRRSQTVPSTCDSIKKC